MRIVNRQQGRIRLEMMCVRMGLDACLIITGGDRPHLGAVAVSQIRESLADVGRKSSTTSNITLPGHKEDILARDMASRLAVAISANVAVCCGIHLDDISCDEIKSIVEMCSQMLEEIIKQVVNCEAI